MQEFEKLLEDIGSSLPDLPEIIPKNIFDILGVRNQENVNSKILAYFLDVNETHGLQTLFFDSLKTIVENKVYADIEFLDVFNGDFNVLTEDTTAFAENEAKKRIDISILGDDKWGIIIENKLYHILVNPLKAYWEHTQKTCGDNIIGVLLTLNNLGLKDDKKEIAINGNQVVYLNITHQEWIAEVQSQLNIGDIQNLEGLLYLKEYIKTIQSHYTSKMDESTYNAIAYSIIKHQEEVQAIQLKISQTEKFIDQQIRDVFATYGYEKRGSYFTNIEATYPVYFYVPTATRILKENKLWFTLELRNEINKTIRETLKEDAIQSYFKPLLSKHEKIRIGKPIKKDFTHIAIASIPNVINEQNNIKSVLIKILEDSFMGENGLVTETEKFLEALMNIPKN